MNSSARQFAVLFIRRRIVECILVTFNSQECSWNTYTGSVASRSVTTKTYDCQKHDEKSDPLVASFCAFCNAMCSRHKYCKLIKQAKSGDMQFMHVIIALTDTTHATILYKKRGIKCRRGSRNFRQGVHTFVKF